MSSEDVPTRRRHRHTRSVALPSAEPSSQNPQNPHHLNSQAYAQNISDVNYPAQPTTPPRTPRRNNQNQNVGNSITHQNASKQKGRNNKNRPKNVTTSPAVNGYGRTTPPEAQSAGMAPSKPMNTPSSTIFAGATFHASPAPSALPIPSFYSKSVPDSPGMKGLKSMKDPSLSENSDSPTPPVPPFSVNKVPREESPLDFFFRADREEKERARSASSANPAGKVTSPFQPPPVSHRNAHTPAAQGSQRPTSNTSRTSTSGSGMFAMELDGPCSPGGPLGPAFSTPYSERINAAKTTKVREDSQSALDRSEALKAYLFSGQTTPPPASSNRTAIVSSPLTPNSPQTSNERNNTASRSQANGFPFTMDGRAKNNGNTKASVRTSGLRQEVTPSKTPTMTPHHNTHFANSPTPSRIYGNVTNSNSDNFMATHAASPSPALSYGVASGDRNTDIQGMEDSLRKILKLDSPRISGVQDPRKAPTTYIAGMNNGVMRS